MTVAEKTRFTADITDRKRAFNGQIAVIKTHLDEKLERGYYVIFLFFHFSSHFANGKPSNWLTVGHV